MSNHPNAATATGSGGLSVIILAICEKFGWHVDPLVAAAIATAAAGLALFVGRSGLRGLIRIVWKGNQP